MKKQNSAIDKKIEKMEKQEKIEAKNDKIKYGPGKRGGLIIGTVAACVVLLVGGGLLVNKLAGSSKYKNHNSVAVYTGQATSATTTNTAKTQAPSDEQATTESTYAESEPVDEADLGIEDGNTDNETEHGDFPDAPLDDTFIRDTNAQDNIISVEPDIISTNPTEYNFIGDGEDDTWEQTQNDAPATTTEQTAKSTTAPSTIQEQVTYPPVPQTESSTKASTTATPASTSSAPATTTSSTTQYSGGGGTWPNLGTISTYTTLGGKLSDWFD